MVPEGVEHVKLRVRMPHETGNWLVVTDYSNAFNTVNRTLLAEAVNCVPALAPSMIMCYGTKLAHVFLHVDSGITRMIGCSGAQQWGCTGGKCSV